MSREDSEACIVCGESILTDWNPHTCNDCGKGAFCLCCWSEHQGNGDRCSEAPAKAASMAPITKYPDAICKRCKGRGAVRVGMFSRRYRPCRCTMTEAEMKSRIAEGKRP